MIIGDQTFSAMVSKFAKQAPEQANAVIRKSTLELFTDIIMDTPVDEGRARGNWQLSFGQPTGGTVDAAGDKESDTRSSSPTVSEVTNKLNADRSNLDIYLSNNLPYIKGLEYGRSRKSPRGMVRKNLMKANITLLKYIRESAANRGK